MLADFRYAPRRLLAAPAFTAVAVLTLALGIGANTALFTLLNGLFLHPFPGLGAPERLVWVSAAAGPVGDGGIAYPEYLEYRARATTLASVTAYRATPLSLGSGGEPARVDGQLVAANYFQTLGVGPALGRTLLPADEAPGAPPVAVVSYRLWSERLVGDSAAIGRPATINGHAFTVVGVARREFVGTEIEQRADVWAPAATAALAAPQDSGLLTTREWPAFRVVGRLAAGASAAEAGAELATLATAYGRAYPASRTGAFERMTVNVSPVTGQVSPGEIGSSLPLVLLAGAVTALVLLIACANVAGLLLGRAAAGRRDVAIRVALGATRFRIVRQLLVESVTLVAAGALLGVLVALWTADLLLATVGAPLVFEPRLDGRVLAFTAALALATGVLFGLVPALAASRPDLAPTLKDDALAGGSGRRACARAVFVVSQTALSVVLLAVAGLFLRSLGHASRVDVGFDAARVVTLSLDLALQGYRDADARAFDEQLLERARALPGVESASLAASVPFGWSQILYPITLEEDAAGSRAPASFDRGRMAYTNSVWPGYFRTLGIRLVRGRDFTAADARGAAPVAVVSEAFALRRWPGRDPIGRRLSAGGAGGPFHTVVGIARDAKYGAFTERAEPYVYFPVAQRPAPTAGMTLVVRTRGDADALAAALRREVRAMDPALPVYRAQTMRAIVGERLAEQRRGASLLALFAALALGLAALGLYGVVAYAVTQRRREVGVRIALGAGAADVVRLFVGEGARLALAGLGAGLLLALAAGRLVSSMLVGVGAADALTLTGVSLVLLAASILASWLPARRAARVDPMVALRSE